MRNNTKFDPGKEQIQTLAKIVTYAILVNIFLFFCEIFTVFYSHIPDHMLHFKYLFVGLEGKGQLVPFMWFSMVGMIGAALAMVNPKVRANETTLACVCGLIIITTYIDKGLGLISAGFIPNPLEHITEYWPTRSGSHDHPGHLGRRLFRADGRCLNRRLHQGRGSGLTD